MNLSDDMRKKITNAVSRVLVRYCSLDKIEIGHEEERCPKCGSQFLENMYPPRKTSAYGIDFAIADWIKDNGSPLDCDDFSDGFIDFFNDSHDGWYFEDETHSAYEVAQAMGIDMSLRLESYAHDTVADDEDWVEVDGTWYYISGEKLDSDKPF